MDILYPAIICLEGKFRCPMQTASLHHSVRARYARGKTKDED